MPTKPDFDYTPKEMQRRIDEYFLVCEEVGKLPTIPGLCLALEITQRRYNALLKAFNAPSDSEAEREGRKSLQIKHLKILETARMRMCDVIEQRTDTMSIFKLKQAGYAGYVDKPDGNNGDAINIKINLDGVPKNVNPGG